MKIKKYLTNQFFFRFLFLLSILFFTVLFNQIFIVLKESLATPFFLDEIFLIVFLKSLTDLPLLVNLSIFFALLILINKLTNNSEIFVLNSSGIGKFKLAKIFSPIIGYVFLFVLFFSIFFTPILENIIQDLRFHAKENVSRVDLKARNFNSFDEGKLIIFIEEVQNKNTNEQKYQGVFLNFNEKDTNYILLAEEGSKIVVNNDVFLVLNNGYKYSNLQTKQSLQISKFDTIKINLSTNQNKKETSSLVDINNLQSKSIFELIKIDDNHSKGEIFWRISLTLSILTLSTIAIIGSPMTPRIIKSKNYFFNLFFLMVYFSGILVVKSSIESGYIDFLVSILTFHSAFFMAIFIYFFTYPQKLYYKYEK